MGKKWEQWLILFSWAPNTCSLEENYDKPGQCIKKQRHHLSNKGPYSQSYGFSHSQVWMWELGHKEGWAPMNWCFQTVVLKKTLESPLDCKEIKPVQPKGNSVLNIHWQDCCWSSNTLATWCKEQIHWKRPWFWKKLRAKGEGGDGMVGWHHWLNGDGFDLISGR